MNSDDYVSLVTAQQQQSNNSDTTTFLANSITVFDENGKENISIGDSTVVAYQKVAYNSSQLVGIDPVLGDIVIGKNELIILRGGWRNRNGVFFSEDPKTNIGFSTVNIIWKGITLRR